MNFKKEIIFSSDRCFVRPFKKDDINSFMIYRNDMDWMKYQGFKGLSNKEYVKALIKDINIEKGTQLAIVNNLNHNLIGDIYLKKEDKNYWIGYTIAPSYSRKGYALEIVKELIKELKKENDSIIYAGVLTENIPSIKLLEKLGFTFSHISENEKIYKF